MRVLVFMFVVAAALAAVAPTRAEIHACPTASGAIQFQDRPCAIVPRAAAPARPARRAADIPGTAQERPPPLGIDDSWFERPQGSAREPLCDSRGCECGALDRPFDAGLELAVADALYLDGAWHRFEASLVALAAPDVEAAAAQRARIDIDDSACDVLMSQETLRRHAEAVMRRLRKRATVATDLGRDTPLACDGFDPAACEHYESLQLYERMSDDARALGKPRRSILASEPPTTRSATTALGADGS